MTRRLPLCISCLPATSLLLLATACAADHVQIARFQIDVTPPVGFEMAYDPVRKTDELGLSARGIVILGAQQPIVLCAVDWIGIGNGAHDEFRETLAIAAGTTSDRVSVNTLHQHDAPRCDFTAEQILNDAGHTRHGALDGAFARDCLQRLKKAVQNAISEAVPVDHLAIGEANVEGVASNRRIQDETGQVVATRYTTCRDPKLRALPDGIIDPELTSITFLKGKTPVAVLTYYAVHPQSYYRTGIPSPDFPGIARFLRGQDVPDCLHVHFNGAGGNIGAGKYNDGDKGNRVILAQRLAEGMRKAFDAAEPKPLDPADISWAVAPVKLPLGKHLKVEVLAQQVAQWNSKDYWNAPEQLAFAKRCEAGHLTELSCLKLQTARILHMPGELFVEYQLAAKKLRPDLHVAMAAYGDYGPGYIGTAEAYGQGGYEVSERASKVAPEVEQILMDGIKTLLERTDAADSQAAAAPNFKDELPRIPPTPADRALETFQIAPGYQIQQVAAEPLVGSPVAIEWDAQGRMFVCEMRGYSEDREAAISTIGLLTDSDGDGRYDQRTEYASGLLWPTAIFPWDGGLFVGDAPDLWYLKDTDGDGRADHKEVVITGFGTSNVQGLMNSMRWGLDNRIHIACSSAGGKLQRPGSKDSPLDIRGRDIAFDPHTGDFEITTATAQHGMCFDDWGRKFSSANSDHVIQVMYNDDVTAHNPFVKAPSPKVSIASDGPQAEVFRASPVEPWRVVRTRLRVNGKARGPVEGGGRAAGYFTGATGVTIFRGDAWPESDRGLAIVGDVGSNLVHRKKLTGNALPFTAHRIDQESEFITSTDNWFRPSQFANGPDGCLYIVDTYREVIEHPKSLPPEIKQHLDLTAGRKRGRIYRVFPEGHSPRQLPNFSKLSTAALVEQLAHANAWHRETAARLLHEQQDALAAPILESFLQKTESPLGRIHAMSSLAGRNKLNDATLLQLLTDDHAQVRRHAVRLTTARHFWSLPPFRKMAESLVTDANEEVLIEVAHGVSQLPPTDRAALLAVIAMTPNTSKWTDFAIQSSTAEAATELFSILSGSSEQGNTLPIALMQGLADQISRQNNLPDVAFALKALNQIGSHQRRQCLPLYASLLKKSNPAVPATSDPALLQVAQKAGAIQQRLLEQNSQLAMDSTRPPTERLQAIAHFRYATWKQFYPAAKKLLSEENDFQIQQATLNSITGFQDSTIPSLLIGNFQNVSPTLQRSMIRQLLSRNTYWPSLVAAVESEQIPEKAISVNQWQQLANSKDPTVASKANSILETFAKSSRDDVVRAYRSVLQQSGDVDQGQTVFRKQCASCHRVNKWGNPIGPNLATMKARGAESILVNVLDPNREVNPQYFNYTILTTDGLTVSGMIESEGTSSIVLRQSDGTSKTVLRGEIEQLSNTHQSLMPEGLERTISKSQMADLIAFLMQP